MKNNLKGKCNTNQSAITLIALIITIIVMLILAGVTINIAINGGLFGQAQNSTETTKRASAKEAVEIILAEYQTNKYNPARRRRKYIRLLQ